MGTEIVVCAITWPALCILSLYCPVHPHNSMITASSILSTCTKTSTLPPPGVAVDADYVSNHIIKAVGSSAISNAKKHKANVDMILDLVQEAQYVDSHELITMNIAETTCRKSPFFELWTRDQSRNDKFGPSDS
jgi:hypothetical protein